MADRPHVDQTVCFEDLEHDFEALRRLQAKGLLGRL
jgi:hypothetical protein